MFEMALLNWVSLLFLVLALVGSIAFAATRALRTWRTFRRFSDSTSSAIGAVLQKTVAAEEHAVRLSDGAQRLTAAVAALQTSQAEFAVLQAAASEAGSSLFSFRAVVPRK